MAAPMRSTDFRDIVAPILNEEFDGVYDQRQDEWSKFAREFTGIARAYHEEPVLYGFGPAPEVPDGTAFTYQSGGELFNQRYVYKVYGMAFALTKVLVEDGDHIRIGQTMSRHLAQSLTETKELLGAQILNYAFNGSYPGGDGVSLINTAHPIVTGTFSNQLTTAANLSQTSLEQILIQILERDRCQRQEDQPSSSPDRHRAEQHVPGRSSAQERAARRNRQQRHQPDQVDGAAGQRGGDHLAHHFDDFVVR